MLPNTLRPPRSSLRLNSTPCLGRLLGSARYPLHNLETHRYPRGKEENTIPEGGIEPIGHLISQAWIAARDSNIHGDFSANYQPSLTDGQGSEAIHGKNGGEEAVVGEEKKVIIEQCRLLFKTMDKDLKIGAQESTIIRNVFQDANLRSGYLGQPINIKQIENCLNEYIGKIFKNQGNNDLLNYLAEKHKITFNRKVMNYGKVYGLKKEDFHKIRKYKI